jgi:tRNA(Ile)-lysidine synthase
MMDLVDRVRRTIRRQGLAAAETRVVAALSGGSDSVALTHILHELSVARELRLVGLAHFNHQLRTQADADERFCADMAARLGLPFMSGREDVAALARRERRSIEDAARRARHGFLEVARAAFTADVVALGHTKDDQAETFLLRLLRGAGTKGLASMHPRAGAAIRPLLETRRGALRQYLARHAIAYVADASNDDVSIPRNRVRAELLPLIERRFNPSIVDVLANEAEIARGQYWHLTGEAEEWLKRFASRAGQRRVLSSEALAAAPLAVARTVAHLAMTEVSHGRPVAFEDVERMLDLARTGGPPFDATGQRVERIGADVVLTGRPAGATGRPTFPPPNALRQSLDIPGEVQLPGGRRVLSAEVADSWDQVRALTGAHNVAVVQLESEGGATSLSVRHRRPGDRFRPFGLEGRKTLQDFFVDRKVARERRDEVPLVVDAADRIVWVAGHTIDHAFRVKDPAQTVIILRLNGVGGSV